MPRSKNLARQVLGLIDHAFVRYPVPLFLYRGMLTHEGMALVFGIKFPPFTNFEKPHPEVAYRKWFLAVARGESLADLARDVFTRKEAHYFLLAPNGNTIEENIRLARYAAAGLCPGACDYLVKKLDSFFISDLGPKLSDFLRFFRDAWGHMEAHEADEMLDFIRWRADAPSFSLKGRTLGSMRKLCDEWHRLFEVEVEEYQSWKRAFQEWGVQRNSVTVRAVEITNNLDLAEEGRTQRHCVSSYAQRCSKGSTAIVSLRWYAAEKLLSRLTIEVNLDKREIVQIRGKVNRAARSDEMKVVRLWASDSGLTIWKYVC